MKSPTPSCQKQEPSGRLTLTKMPEGDELGESKLGGQAPTWGRKLVSQLSMRILTFVLRKAPLARKAYVKVYTSVSVTGPHGKNQRLRLLGHCTQSLGT